MGLGLTYNQLKRHLGDEDEFVPFYELFMTKNGQFLSKFVFHRETFSQCTWFPCVGTDCPCPIEMNFGNKGVPFAFDIVQYEKDEVRPPPAPRRSGRAKAGKKKAPEVVAPAVPDVAESPTLLFRAPYSAESHYEGGLYRSREFWGQVKAHLDGNDLALGGDDGEDGEDEEMWDDVGCGGSEGGEDSGDSEDESVTINGDQDDNGGDGFSEDGDENEFSSDADSIASESSGELVPDNW